MRVNTGAALASLVIAALACDDTLPIDIDQPEGVPCLAGGTPPAFPDMPARLGPAAMTTGMVPHQEINPAFLPEVIDDMSGRIFVLPEVESRISTIVDDATAIWLRPEVPLGRPECVIREREIGHIHPDGSLHISLPHGRIPGAAAAGWVERHPWADTHAGFEAYVMIFSPRDSGEVDVIVELVELAIDFVVGS